jgi:hypothetical protein
MPVDELRLLDLFRGQRVNAAGLVLPLTQRGRSQSIPDGRAAQPLLAIACFTCFIRLRSGIANSL